MHCVSYFFLHLAIVTSSNEQAESRYAWNINIISIDTTDKLMYKL